MKKLISARTVKQAHKDGLKQLQADPAVTLVTPEARTVAKQLGVQLIEDTARKTAAQNSDSAVKVDEKTVRDIVTRVMAKLPPQKQDPDKVKQVVVDVLSKYVK